MDTQLERDHADGFLDVNSHEDALSKDLQDLDAQFTGLTFQILTQQLTALCGSASTSSQVELVYTERDGTSAHVLDDETLRTIRILQRCLGTVKARLVASYTVRVLLGYDPLVWHEVTLALGAASEIVAALLSKPVSENESSPISERAGLLLELVRDAVFVARGMLGGEHVPQELAAAAGLDEKVWSLLELCVSKLYSQHANSDMEEEQDEEEGFVHGKVLRDIVKLGFQFVNNLLIDNETRKIALWHQLFRRTTGKRISPEKVSRIRLLLQAVAVLHGDELLPLATILRMYLDPGLVSTSNATAHGAEIQELRSQALLQFGEGRDLLSELFAKAGAVQDRSGARTQAVVVEIVRCVLHWNLFVNAYEACAGSGTISDGQEFLLRCLTWISVDEIEPGDALLGKVFAGDTVDLDGLVLIPHHGILVAVKHLISILQDELSPEFLRALDFQRKVITGTDLGGESYIIDFPGLEMKVKAFAELFGVLAQDVLIRSFLVAEDLIASFITILGTIEMTIPKLDFKGIIKGTGALQENAPEMLTNVEWGREPLYMWPDLKSGLVSTISSLVCDNKASQDMARACDGVELILNCCRYDQNNPMLKEFSILALKYLLANNDENQQVVRDLQSAQQSFVVPEDVADKISLSAHNLALNR